MNEHKEHITHYSAADIQKYVQGKLSARDMHAMEKAALDDPFLADAIEGMQQAFADHNESLVTGQLQQLQQEFTTRTAPTTGKVIAFKPFRYWQAAAAAIVVIITGVWVYSLLNDNSASSEQVTVAKTEETTPAPQQKIPTPPAIDEANNVAADSAVLSNSLADANQQAPVNKSVKSNAGADKDDRANVTNNYLSPAKPAAAPGKLAWSHNDSSAALKDVAAETKEAPTPAPVQDLAKSRRDGYDAKMAERERETELITIAKNESFKKKAVTKDKNLSGFVKGQVTDVNHNPVANAYIQLYKQTNNNFVTDKSGFFKIPVTDSIVDVAVNVSGYGTQSFRLQNLATVNQLQLQPANVTLTNAVQNNATANRGNNYNYRSNNTLSSNNTASSSNTVPNVMVHDAEPAFGWVAFEQYLEKNKKAPDSVNMRGNVLVSFEVNKKGNLSDFKIMQSLSKAHNDEAVRLIMQGPSWAPVNGKRKARVTVMVRF